MRFFIVAIIAAQLTCMPLLADIQLCSSFFKLWETAFRFNSSLHTPYTQTAIGIIAKNLTNKCSELPAKPPQNYLTELNTLSLTDPLEIDVRAESWNNAKSPLETLHALAFALSKLSEQKNREQFLENIVKTDNDNFTKKLIQVIALTNSGFFSGPQLFWLLAFDRHKKNIKNFRNFNKFQNPWNVDENMKLLGFFDYKSLLEKRALHIYEEKHKDLKDAGQKIEYTYHVEKDHKEFCNYLCHSHWIYDYAIQTTFSINSLRSSLNQINTKESALIQKCIDTHGSIKAILVCSNKKDEKIDGDTITYSGKIESQNELSKLIPIDANKYLKYIDKKQDYIFYSLFAQRMPIGDLERCNCVSILE